MLNFTVGPVLMQDEIRGLGKEQIPYFRTSEFSKLIFENEELIKKFFYAPKNSRAVFLTGSGTAAMEAAVMNIFKKEDKLLIVNGGSFGERFVKIAKIHEIPYDEIKLEFGKTLKKEDLMPYENKGYTGLLINHHETSTGVLYDIRMVGDFCKKNGMRLVVDAISSFLADKIDMASYNISAILTGSQKALALPPGLSVIVLDDDAVKAVCDNEVKSIYFDLGDYLLNGERGQTPFTPAVSVLIQLNKRLRMIDKSGLLAEQEKIRELAEDFREKIKELPFEITSDSLSNAVTPITNTNGISAYKIFETLKDEYNIYVCPNGAELKDRIFRVGHIGNLKKEDNDTLISALKDMEKRGKI